MLLQKNGEVTLGGMKRWTKAKTNVVVAVTGDGSKVWCCKEQYCIGTWNVRSMNQGKLEVVKQEMARVNVDILGIREIKWTGKDAFKSDDHYIYYCGQESLRRNWSSHHSQQKSPKCSTWMQSQKWQNDLFVSKANHSISWYSKSMPWPVTLKKLKLNSSVKTEEGDGTPLQSPCLENPMDEGAW